MVKNLWEIVHVWCGGDHDVPVEMMLREGPMSSFYSCPKYYPENREEGEKACVNHIGPYEFEKFISHIGNLIVEAAKNGEKLYLEGYEWCYKSIRFKILKHTSECLDVQVFNKGAVARR